MMFEDAIRVAQIKTRRGRLTRVRAEIGAHDGEPVDLVDYLSPSWDDVRSILPAPVAAVFAPRDRVNAVRGSRPIRIRTSGILGFAALKALAALRPLRSASARFVAEQRGIDLWLAALMAAAPRDYRVACRIAKLASLARGYGAS
jgi:indolepyruvate ferredoxin oxidoreductase beta subunit